MLMTQCHGTPWWRHQMETFSALLAFCAGNSVNSPHKGQWRGALMFSLICTRINDWVNNREAGYLRRHRGHYDVNVMPRRGSIRSFCRGNSIIQKGFPSDNLIRRGNRLMSRQIIGTWKWREFDAVKTNWIHYFLWWLCQFVKFSKHI